jgi:multidrug resistance efflux pump
VRDADFRLRTSVSDVDALTRSVPLRQSSALTPDTIAPSPEERKRPAQSKSKGSSPRISRIIKLGIGLAFLAAGAYALLAQNAYLSTKDAIVTANFSALRAPVDGYLTDVVFSAGMPVTVGKVVAHIRNPDRDPAQLASLRQRLAQARSEHEAITVEQKTLADLQEDLTRRGQAHNAAVTQELEAQVAQATLELQSKLIQHWQQQRDSDRASVLETSGFAAHADAEKSRLTAAGADRDAEALRARLDGIVAQQKAAKQGIMADTSGNDVAYSLQRADELTIRQAELTRQSAIQRANVTMLAADVTDAERRFSLLANAPVFSPATGIIWKMSVSPDERLAPGDLLAEVVNCQTAFVLASVPQDRLSGISVGSEVRIRLAGEATDRAGRVTFVGSQSSSAVDDHFAASLPTGSTGGSLRITLPVSEGEGCLIGRNAQVMIPTGGDTWLRRFGRLVF